MPGAAGDTSRARELRNGIHRVNRVFIADFESVVEKKFFDLLGSLQVIFWKFLILVLNRKINKNFDPLLLIILVLYSLEPKKMFKIFFWPFRVIRDHFQKFSLVPLIQRLWIEKWRIFFVFYLESHSKINLGSKLS